MVSSAAPSSWRSVVQDIESPCDGLGEEYCEFFSICSEGFTCANYRLWLEKGEINNRRKIPDKNMKGVSIEPVRR